MNHPPTLCRFDHPGFAALSQPLFRLTEGDHLPALTIELDGSQAVIPLPAVAKLFAIAPDTGDGRMLNLVGSALRFVVCLRLGDPLPTEVLTGEASWEPLPHHRQLAAARLQLQLVDWIGAATPVTADMLVADDPVARPLVQESLRRAAQELGLGTDGPAVTALVGNLAAELSYIEALRERLLDRVQALLRRLLRLGQGVGQASPARRETLLQVTRLTAVGVAEITALFDQVDDRTADILTALRNLEQQRSFLRPNRDWLYCTQRAWDAELKQWDAVHPAERGEPLWKALDRLYRFVAPRFMAVQEWQKLDDRWAADPARATFVW